MRYLDLPKKTNIKQPKKRGKYRTRRGAEATRLQESRYCQKVGCGYQGEDLYEIPHGYKVSTTSETSSKRDRKIIKTYIKVCKNCKEKYDKEISK